jgi:hypothetical protein
VGKTVDKFYESVQGYGPQVDQLATIAKKHKELMIAHAKIKPEAFQKEGTWAAGKDGHKKKQEHLENGRKGALEKLRGIINDVETDLATFKAHQKKKEDWAIFKKTNPKADLAISDADKLITKAKTGMA